MKRTKFLKYFGLLTLLTLMVKIFYGVSPFMQGWFFSNLWMLAYFFIFPKDFSQKSTIWFYCFFIVVIYYFLLGSTCKRLDEFSDIVYFSSYFLYPYMYFYFLVNHTDARHRKIVCAVLTVIFILYAFRTLMLTRGDTYFVRRILAQDINVINQYRFLGLVDYSLVHAVIFIVPVYVYMFKASKRTLVKIFVSLLIMITFVLVYLGGSSTALMMFLGAIIISFFINSKNSTKTNMMIIFFSLSIVLFFINNEVLTNLLDFLRMNLPEGSPYLKKVDDLQNSLLYESAEGDVDTRLTLYANSWDTFMSYPLGTLDGRLVGGHAYFIDMLAAVGVFALLLFAYLFSIFYYSYYLIPRKTRTYFFLGILLFVMMGLVKNLSGYDFFVIPILYIPLLCLTTKSSS